MIQGGCRNAIFVLDTGLSLILDCQQTMDRNKAASELFENLSKGMSTHTASTSGKSSQKEGLRDIFLKLEKLKKLENSIKTLFVGFRLDYIFLSRSLAQNRISSSIEPILIPDHAPVVANFDLLRSQPKSSRWRFNNFLLQDTVFSSSFTSFAEELFSLNENPSISPALVWDTFLKHSS